MIYVRANNSGIKVTNTLIIINHNKAPHTCSVRVQEVWGAVVVRGTAWAAACKPHAGP